MTTYKQQVGEIRRKMWDRYSKIEKTGDEQEKKNRFNAHRQWCRELLELVERNSKVGISLPFSKEEIDRSEDPYLNDLPLKKWDLYAEILISRRLVFSLSDGVCVLKEKARLLSGR